MEARSAGAPPPKKRGENGKKEKEVIDKGKSHGQEEEKKGTKSEEETLQEFLKMGRGQILWSESDGLEIRGFDIPLRDNVEE
jgi:hypothetical protein